MASSMGAANTCALGSGGRSPVAASNNTHSRSPVAAANGNSNALGRSRRQQSAVQSPVDLIELEPTRLPMPPRQSRAPPPALPSDEASLLSSSRALYSSPMRPSQYVARPAAAAGGGEGDEEAARIERQRRLERVSLEQALLSRRWQVHSASALVRFQREQLSAYAHDLVKALRATALRASGRQFGYSVSIRRASPGAVVFLVREDRRAGSARRRAGRASDAAPGAPDAAPEAPEERTAAFALFFPAESERRRPRKGREEQQVLLLRGDEELLAWSCSWLQRSFQCVVDARPVRVSELNLRRLARNLVVSSLMAQRGELSAAAEPEQTPGEKQETQEEEEEEVEGKATARAPLTLEFRNPDARAPMQTYTLTIPWEALRRIYDKAEEGNGGHSSSSNKSGAVPEILEMVERVYFDALPFDLSAFSLTRFETQDVAMGQGGDIELYDLSVVHAVLFSLYDLLAIQDAPGPHRPAATF